MRKNQAKKRFVLPDPIYKSTTITKLINKIMLDGKKGLAQKILYDAFELVQKKTKQDPLEVFHSAIDQVMPQIELRTRRIGGSNYRIPIEISSDRQMILALRWIVNYARIRNEKTMVERLSNEIIDASKGHGASVKRKDEVHAMAEANKAFAHYRW